MSHFTVKSQKGKLSEKVGPSVKAMRQANVKRRLSSRRPQSDNGGAGERPWNSPATFLPIIGRSMSSQGISQGLVDRLYRQANAVRWHLSVDLFAATLEASATRAFSGAQPNSRDLERYLSSLHLEDLALGCACAAGDEAAWDHFIREHRPVLYRAADALDPAGGVRELADSLYADLYGLQSRSGERQSLFRYFHGRSSLATWLRAVLAQRHVDRVRAGRRTESLPDEDSRDGSRAGKVRLKPDTTRGFGTASTVLATQWEPPDPDRAHNVNLIRRALRQAVARLKARDQLRLGCYYGQGLTLAQTGRLLREHEATVSRQLARTRRAIRQDVEHQLRAAGLSDVQIARCFECVLEDSGPIDLNEMLQTDVERDQQRVVRPAATERTCKNAEPDRS